MKEITIILGPTASGKTSISVPLAKIASAEIISADSRQVYRKLDIGTAKPSMDEREGVPHHLIDVVNPDQEFTVADFQRMAFENCDEIHSRGREVLVVGGTGLYIRALVDRPSFHDQPAVPEIREALLDEIENHGAADLYRELCEIDPAAAEKIHANNIPRLIRALEIIRGTGKKFSDVIEKDKNSEPFANWKLIGLNMDRTLLYERIDRRVDEMFNLGWVEEVRRVLAMGYTGDEKPLAGLGYRDVVRLAMGEITLEAAKALIKRDTRRFAKRQMTWFRSIENVQWVELPGDFNSGEISERIYEFSTGKSC